MAKADAKDNKVAAQNGDQPVKVRRKPGRVPVSCAECRRYARTFCSPVRDPRLTLLCLVLRLKLKCDRKVGSLFSACPADLIIVDTGALRDLRKAWLLGYLSRRSVDKCTGRDR